MKITKQLNNKVLLILLEGELNTTTAPELEGVVKNDLLNVQSLIIDMEDLTYLTSAGLRVLLVASKIMNDKKGQMVIRHANESIMEVFNITGFDNILNIEN